MNIYILQYCIWYFLRTALYLMFFYKATSFESTFNFLWINKPRQYNYKSVIAGSFSITCTSSFFSDQCLWLKLLDFLEFFNHLAGSPIVVQLWPLGLPLFFNPFVGVNAIMHYWNYYRDARGCKFASTFLKTYISCKKRALVYC